MPTINLQSLKDKTLRAATKAAIAQGGRPSHVGAHVKVYCPWHRTPQCRNPRGYVTVPTTPNGGKRSVANTLADFKRCGFTV